MDDDRMTVRAELDRMGLAAVSVERSRDDASLALDTAIPTAQARELCERLQSDGVEASWAPDHDDRSLAWVYL